MNTSTHLKTFLLFGKDFKIEKWKKPKSNSSSHSQYDPIKNLGHTIPSTEFTAEEAATILSGINSDYFVTSCTHVSFRSEFQFIATSRKDVDMVKNRILELTNQKLVVTRQISRLIQDHHNQFMEEIDRLSNIQTYLEFASCNCRYSRTMLDNALVGIKNGGLRILLYFKKKERLESLLKQLSRIKILHRADLWLNTRLSFGNYKEASHICMIFLKALNSFHCYLSCVDLSSKLLDIQKNIIIQLDDNLYVLCQRFDALKYNDLMSAYCALDMGEVAIDKFVLNFIDRLKKCSMHTILNYCNKHAPKDSILLDDATNLSSIFSHFESHFDDGFLEESIELLISICCSICEIWFYYIDICSHHESLQDIVSHGRDIPKSLLSCKLKQGKVLLWLESEKTVLSLLHFIHLNFLNFHDFLHLVEIINIFNRIGISFCDVQGSLRDNLHKLISSYFSNFHKERLNQLKFFLENESWEFCPLPGGFNINQLYEFDFLIHRKFEKYSEIDLCPSSSISSFTAKEFDVLNMQDRIIMLNSLQLKNSSHSLLCCKSFISVGQELHFNKGSKELIGSQANRTQSNATSNDILISNTTLVSLRFMGRYIQLIQIIKPIAMELFIYLTQIYKFYLYTVYLYFAHVSSFSSQNPIIEFYGMESHDNYFSSKLKNAISNIEQDMLLNEKEFCTLNMYKTMAGDKDLYGLRYRIIGIESLIFLSEQLYFLRPIIELLLSSNASDSKIYSDISTFYTQYVQLSYGLRRPIYSGLARYIIDYDQILQKIMLIKWDFKELTSEHNPYIDFIIKEFEIMAGSVSQLSNFIPVSQLARNMLFEECSSIVNKLLVEGFATIKKCNNNGRALMLLDFRQYIAEVEKTCQIKILDKIYVEDYIHAYYLEDEELDRWVLEHKNYSNSQLNMLVNLRISFTKRKTNKFLNF